MPFELDFISEKNFEEHVKNTIKTYNKSLEAIDLKKFNSNVIDPIKLTFDKNVFRKSFEQIVNDEISRQRDKSNNNAIGYFHQNIFQYIKNCEVPKSGWDVIVNLEDKTRIYVEMKNKHNTMNSSASQKIYIQMQNQIIKTPSDKCFLVEAIAPKSRNIPWGCSVNGQHVESERIRRVSMDKFYAVVTGDSTAFYKMCMKLPETIEKVIAGNKSLSVGKDTVLDELLKTDRDIQKALYKLAFNSYDGFNFC
ncbi:MAG: Eco47II family restriction endonuclease [Oscillospiraceae bacterium]|nr:Eco47II family restriction endonuclease [Oscillospiraceae bacterium]